MIRKNHLSHTVKSGPVCQAGKTGGALRGEHITYPFAEFAEMPAEHQCAKCRSSKLFAFLVRRAA